MTLQYDLHMQIHSFLKPNQTKTLSASSVLLRLHLLPCARSCQSLLEPPRGVSKTAAWSESPNVAVPNRGGMRRIARVLDSDSHEWGCSCTQTVTRTSGSGHFERGRPGCPTRRRAVAVAEQESSTRVAEQAFSTRVAEQESSTRVVQQESSTRVAQQESSTRVAEQESSTRRRVRAAAGPQGGRDAMRVA